MPYSNSVLPLSIRDRLPRRAQDIFLVAFNHAWGNTSVLVKPRGLLTARTRPGLCRSLAKKEHPAGRRHTPRKAFAQQSASYELTDWKLDAERGASQVSLVQA